MKTLRNSLLATIGLCLLPAVTPPATSADETAANAWIATAREAAQADEHTQSIKAFENAMSEDSSTRSGMRALPTPNRRRVKQLNICIAFSPSTRRLYTEFSG